MIDTPLLRHLLQAGKAGPLVARGVPGGFVLAMQEGLEEMLLEAQRGGARRFKTLEAVASYLQGLGCATFTVDVSQWGRDGLDLREGRHAV